MSYRGINPQDNTVQIWNGTAWVAYDPLTFTVSGSDGIITSPLGDVSLVGQTGVDLNAVTGDVSAVATAGTFSAQGQTGAVVTATTGDLQLLATDAAGNIVATGGNDVTVTAAAGDATFAATAGFTTINGQTGVGVNSAAGDINIAAPAGFANVSGDSGASIASDSGDVAIDATSGMVNVDSPQTNFTGTVTVAGSTIAVDSQITLADRYIDINVGQTTAGSLTSGMSTNSNTLGVSTGIVSFDNGTDNIEVADTTGISVDDIVEVANADTASNNGRFAVASIVDGTNLAIKSAPTNTGILQTSVDTSAVAGGTLTLITIDAWRFSGAGTIESTFGNTSDSAAWTWTAGVGAATTLQGAYDNGTAGTAGDIVLSASDFAVTSVGADNFDVSIDSGNIGLLTASGGITVAATSGLMTVASAGLQMDSTGVDSWFDVAGGTNQISGENGMTVTSAATTDVVGGSGVNVTSGSGGITSTAATTFNVNAVAGINLNTTFVTAPTSITFNGNSTANGGGGIFSTAGNSTGAAPGGDIQRTSGSNDGAAGDGGDIVDTVGGPINGGSGSVGTWSAGVASDSDTHDMLVMGVSTNFTAAATNDVLVKGASGQAEWVAAGSVVGVTLQAAYEGGNTITTDAVNGTFDVSGTETITLNAAAGTGAIQLFSDSGGVSIQTGGVAQLTSTGGGLDISNGSDLVFTSSGGANRLALQSGDDAIFGPVGGVAPGDVDPLRINQYNFPSPVTQGSAVTFNLPATDGAANDVLITDGSGDLSFVSAGSIVGITLQDAYEGGNTIVLDAANGLLGVNGTEDIQFTVDGQILLQTNDNSGGTTPNVILTAGGDVTAGSNGGGINQNAGFGENGFGAQQSVSGGTTAGGGNWTASAGSATGADHPGGAASLSSGGSTGTNPGGEVLLSAGGGSGAGGGGRVRAVAGEGGGGGNGGAIELITGGAVGTGSGGNFLLTGGGGAVGGGYLANLGNGTTTGGTYQVQAGDGPDAGAVVLEAGDSTTANPGGQIAVLGGTSASGDGGDIAVWAGNGGPNGGTLQLQSGGGSNGAPALITVAGAAAGGGDITLATGAGVSAGALTADIGGTVKLLLNATTATPAAGQVLSWDGTQNTYVTPAAGAASKTTTAIAAGATATPTATDLQDNETTYLADTSAVGTALTLPSPAPANGTVVRLKDASGNANTNNLVVNTAGAETLDGVTGAAAATIATPYGALTVQSDGTNYFIV